MRLDTGRTLETTARSLEVIEAVRALGGARITELADHLDRNKSTVHNHLSTLRQHGYVVMDGDEYNLGLRFSNLGTYARNRKPAYRRARRLTDRLAEETGLDSDFIVEEHGRGVYLETEVDTEDPNILPHVGDRIYLHSAAAGKAILAEYPTEHVETIVDYWGTPRQTENTITDSDELFEALERVRERGYAFNRGENDRGVRAVGAAVRGSGGTIIGSASVSGPNYRMRGDWFERELPNTLLEEVEQFEEGL